MFIDLLMFKKGSADKTIYYTSEPYNKKSLNFIVKNIYKLSMSLVIFLNVHHQNVSL